ncbi:aminotransferase class I/II-fold pyridoxal phosphate-dependent enzyme [Alkalicoccus luteus]|uniref:aminotransferase class I/II-fold pyridoxal phosphate-dependent enzyme n=1 Tax=Alkalicoccus luteus TaxID=1237094 RepID=UPI00197B0D6C|nr:aminotransferase class I/II-fold pyridoxal phosphate-dependent enzyme [Alkalicoccus luteus]
MKNIRAEPIYLSPPHLGGTEADYVGEAFRDNWIAPVGPHIKLFEEEMAAYCGVNRAVALSSGTAAIHLALDVLGVGKGDRVYCSTLTFVASANPVLYQQAEPVFIDSDPETWNMSPEVLERALKFDAARGKLPKACIVVNLYGQSADLKPINQLCRKYGVYVVEDAAESLGAVYQSSFSGTLGDIGIFSFNGNKIITTSGGGMLVTDNADFADQAAHLATQAKEAAEHYEHTRCGYNYRMSNISAGIGRGQLRVLNRRVNEKRTIYQRYAESALPFTYMPEASYGRATRWLTAALLPEGVASVPFIHKLRTERIEARRVWKPLHLQPLFKHADSFLHERNTAEMLFNRGICLPSGTAMSASIQQEVIGFMEEYFHQSNPQEAVVF